MRIEDWKLTGGFIRTWKHASGYHCLALNTQWRGPIQTDSPVQMFREMEVNCRVGVGQTELFFNDRYNREPPEVIQTLMKRTAARLQRGAAAFDMGRVLVEKGVRESLTDTYQAMQDEA